jgi:DNA-binding LacI/PurR family transcriptional regulator
MKVGLAEIAERAGVSISTVSRVLNGKPGVNERTRNAVLTALDVLGYDAPGRVTARALGLVGLVIPELENPFFPRLAQLIETGFAGTGYSPVLCSQSREGMAEDDYIPILLEHGVAGIIFVSGLHAIAGSRPERYQRLIDRGLPLVCVNGHVPGLAAGFVATDDHAGLDLSIAHLASMGHSRVGIAVGQRRYTPVLRKTAGFVDAMRRHVNPAMRDSELAEVTSSTTFTVEGGALAASQLLDRGVTAIVCGSDVMALGAIRAVRQRGLDVPVDVSVIGADDNMLNEFTSPPLTTVRQPAAAIARAAVRSMLDQIRGEPPADGELLLQPELVVRGSTGRCPTRAGPAAR